jgi:lipoprotein-anchoring transpeptidase ErfK/SrfK
MRLVVALALVLAAAVPIVIGVALTAGGGSAARDFGLASTVGAKSFQPVTSTPPPTHSPAPPPRPTGTLVADVRQATELRGAPNGRPIAKQKPRTEFGSPVTLLVASRAPGWLGVLSPLAGNGRVGWIPESAAKLHTVTYELKVSLSAHRLTVLDRGSVLARYSVAVGGAESPTPTGRFAVTDRLAPKPPTGAYGCCIIALSAHSPHAIQGWTGGDRIAIHSTFDSGTIGQDVSHGCVRVNFDQGRWLMRHVPLGTPAVITR